MCVLCSKALQVMDASYKMSSSTQVPEALSQTTRRADFSQILGIAFEL